jgi:hypothetical protein
VTTLFPRGVGASTFIVRPAAYGIAIDDAARSRLREAIPIAVYRPDGTLDPTFGSGGKVTTDFGGDSGAKDVAFDADADLVVAGGVCIDCSRGRAIYDERSTRPYTAVFGYAAGGLEFHKSLPFECPLISKRHPSRFRIR